MTAKEWILAQDFLDFLEREDLVDLSQYDNSVQEAIAILRKVLEEVEVH